MEAFFIKIKIRGYLENKKEKNKETFDTIGIKNKNKISYSENNVIHKITLLEDKIILIRESKTFAHQMIFQENKVTNSQYYIKEYETSVNIPIITKKIKKDNFLEVHYKIIDSNEEFIYKIEMSE